MSDIVIKGLSKVYNQGHHNEVRALDAVGFEIPSGQFLTILGASGAGKSTLLNILGGMDVASEGSYVVDGNDVSKYDDAALGNFRRGEVGFVFQFYNLLPQLTAYENVLLAASVVESPLDAAEVLEKVGLKDRKNNFPSELSGGEQQRVAIARAIVKNPKLLLCDEPTGALDSKTGGSIVALLREVSTHYGKTVVVVTHNSKLSLCSDRTIRIADGKLISDEMNPNPMKAEDISW